MGASWTFRRHLGRGRKKCQNPSLVDMTTPEQGDKMKFGRFFITASLTLFVAAGFFAVSKGARAAECAAQIEATAKHYATSREKYRYSEKLAGKIEKFLKKAQLRLDQGKKKGCFKLVKKARAKIAYRENKAKGSGKGAGKNTAKLSGRGKGGGNKAKCATELKAVEKRYNDFFMNNTGIPPGAQRTVERAFFRAEAYSKEGKYKKCRNQIKKVSKKLEFFEGR